MMMIDVTEQALLGRSGFPSDVSEEVYRRALARAAAYLRTARDLHERASIAKEVADARFAAAERTLRIARQVLARLQMLGRRFDRN
jgi:hypothetical protein